MPSQRTSLRRFLSGEEKLWKTWWLWGVPVALSATAFTLGAEFLRHDGHPRWGDLLDVLKLLVYAAWLTAAWRSAENTTHFPSRLAARIAVAAGVVTAALTI